MRSCSRDVAADGRRPGAAISEAREGGEEDGAKADEAPVHPRSSCRGTSVMTRSDSISQMSITGIVRWNASGKPRPLVLARTCAFGVGHQSAGFTRGRSDETSSPPRPCWQRHPQGFGSTHSRIRRRRLRQPPDCRIPSAVAPGFRVQIQSPTRSAFSAVNAGLIEIPITSSSHQ